MKRKREKYKEQNIYICMFIIRMVSFFMLMLLLMLKFFSCSLSLFKSFINHNQDYYDIIILINYFMQNSVRLFFLDLAFNM